MTSITKWFADRKIQKDAENELVDTIIKSMREESDKWSIDEYNACFGNLHIWISNSPYADMRINDRRLPRRGELRKALAYCLMRKARETREAKKLTRI